MFTALLWYKFFPLSCPRKWKFRSGILGKSKVAQDGSEKNLCILSFLFKKYGEFGNIGLEHFIKHKPVKFLNI